MGQSTTSSFAGAIACLALACTHTYVYGEHAPPTFDDGKLVVSKKSGAERYSIRRIGLTSGDDPYSFRPPSTDEVAQIRAGQVPDGVHTLRIEVDNAWPLWRDWGLAGFGIGASTVLIVMGLAGASEPGSLSGDGITLPLTLILAAAVGLEFMLIGVGFGAGIEGGETDMRYRAYADD